jgi:proline iminopeptidase
LAEKGKAYLEMQMAQNYKNMFAASTGFAENEKYTMISLWSELDLSLPIYGMYGKDDGLFDEDQLSKIQRYAKGGFVLWEDCSHSVFVDRKQDFLSQVQKWLIP